MGLRRPEFRLTSGVRRVGGRQSVADGHTILTVTDSGVSDGAGGTFALFTTAAPHGLTVGANISTTGTTGGMYDASNYSVDGVPTPTTFYSANFSYAGPSTGGQWS